MTHSSLLIHLFFITIITLAQASSSSSSYLQSLSQGKSLAVDAENQFLVSPNGTFSSGFYQVGNNSFCFSIWFSKTIDQTVVWMANRDKPIYGKQSKLVLDFNGNLFLTDADGSIIWSTKTFTNQPVEVLLMETGNLVLQNQSGTIFWQSFDFPTDTLLPEQIFLKNSTLVSTKSRGTYSSGYYYFKFNDDNVLNLIYNGLLVSSIYWPNPDLNVFANGRTRFNSSRIAVLSSMGGYQSSDLFNFRAIDYGDGPKRRLTLDYDGVLRLYSLVQPGNKWTASWFTSGLDTCSVHGLCGENGICVYSPLPTCVCPFGFIRNDPSDWSKGCKPSFELNCDIEEFDFLVLPNVDYYGYDLSSYAEGVTLESCKNSCLKNCKCKGFGYALDGSGKCYPKGILLNGYKKPTKSMIMHIKVPKALAQSEAKFELVKSYDDLNCSGSKVLVLGTYDRFAGKSNKFRYMRFLICFVSSIAAIEFVFIGFGWWNLFRKRVHEELANMGYAVLAMGFKRFTLTELKRATKDFKYEVGRGGFGTVYKGILDDGRVVAVKRLEGILQGQTEFWAEVSIIGKINHKNLVKLWGFCAENRHKMLVYEYIENGSLDKFLFSDSSQVLRFKQRYNIAVGTAKGLSYLHEECLEWVLHCDVKPQNILLDEELEPKVADFGMSKLFRDVNETVFSKVRGTRGYLAPEWMMDLKIDAKADVYSYGIVLLELLSGKNASQFQSFTTIQENKDITLANWMIDMIEEEGIKKVIDPKLKEEFDERKVERLLKVALLCVDNDHNLRPSMSKVVELLTPFSF